MAVASTGGTTRGGRVHGGLRHRVHKLWFRCEFGWFSESLEAATIRTTLGSGSAQIQSRNLWKSEKLEVWGLSSTQTRKEMRIEDVDMYLSSMWVRKEMEERKRGEERMI